MSENLFSKAVSDNETAMFFKGEGKYYAHNPMDGEHCYGVRLSGDVQNFLMSRPVNVEVFNRSLSEFVASLSCGSVDLVHFLANFSEVQRLRKKGLLPGVDYDECLDCELSRAISNYVEHLDCNRSNEELVKMHLPLLERNDSRFLVSLLRAFLEGCNK